MTLRTTAPCCCTKTTPVYTVLRRSSSARKRLTRIVWCKICLLGASSRGRGAFSLSSATWARNEALMRSCREPCMLGPRPSGSASRRPFSALIGNFIEKTTSMTCQLIIITYPYAVRGRWSMVENGVVMCFSVLRVKRPGDQGEIPFSINIPFRYVLCMDCRA